LTRRGARSGRYRAIGALLACRIVVRVRALGTGRAYKRGARLCARPARLTRTRARIRGHGVGEARYASGTARVRATRARDARLARYSSKWLVATRTRRSTIGHIDTDLMMYDRDLARACCLYSDRHMLRETHKHHGKRHQSYSILESLHCLTREAASHKDTSPREPQHHDATRLQEQASNTHTTIASDQRTRRAKRQRQLLLLQVYMTSSREDRSFVRNFRSVRHVPLFSLSPLSLAHRWDRHSLVSVNQLPLGRKDEPSDAISCNFAAQSTPRAVAGSM